MPYREPQTEAEITRLRVAKAALCEVGYPDQAELVIMNLSGHIGSKWFETIEPTPARSWAEIMAFHLAYEAAPCFGAGDGHGYCLSSNGKFVDDPLDLLGVYLQCLETWTTGYRKAQAA